MAVGPHLHVIGYLNYLLVWGSIHQWGFAWQDRTLTSTWWRPFVMAAGGAALLAGLLMWGSFMVDMVGSGEHEPAVDRAARVRRRPGRAASRGRA